VIEIKKLPMPLCIEAPISKSHMQRELLMSLLAEQPSTLIGNFKHLPTDVEDALKVIESLGAKIIRTQSSIRINPPARTNLNDALEVHVGESGFLLRSMLTIGFLFGKRLIIHARGTLLNRAVGLDGEIMKQLGIERLSAPKEWPMVLEKRTPFSSEIEIDGSATSQITSGLLIALSALPGCKKVMLKNPVSLPYLNLTINALINRGVSIRWVGNAISINESIPIAGKEVQIQGDWSGAANILCIGAIAEVVSVEGLQHKSYQADELVLKVLSDFGAKVLHEGAKVVVYPRERKAFTIDLTHAPDLFPLLCVLAAFGEGISTISGTDRLEQKESNRLKSSTELLSRLGVMWKQTGNALEITGGITASKVEVNTYNDHRILLASVVLAQSDVVQVVVNEQDSINKSFPALRLMML